MRIKKPELAAALGLVLYTVGRFAAAGGTLSKYGVSAGWFLFWDVVTIPPYVWGIGRLVRSLSSPVTDWPRLAVATTVALAAFMGPYIYLFMAGAEEFPPLAWVLLGLIIGLLAANAVRDVRKKLAVARHSSALQRPDAEEPGGLA